MTEVGERVTLLKFWADDDLQDRKNDKNNETRLEWTENDIWVTDDVVENLWYTCNGY